MNRRGRKRLVLTLPVPPAQRRAFPTSPRGGGLLDPFDLLEFQFDRRGAAEDRDADLHAATIEIQFLDLLAASLPEWPRRPVAAWRDGLDRPARPDDRPSSCRAQAVGQGLSRRSVSAKLHLISECC